MKNTFKEDFGEEHTILEASMAHTSEDEEDTYYNFDWISLEMVRYTGKKRKTLEIQAREASKQKTCMLAKPDTGSDVN